MIYIIVPTFGRIKETKNFINAIQNLLLDSYLIVIIDDHPENITFKAIKEINNIRIIMSNNELWWVGSINLGINILFNDYLINKNDIIIFANNDVIITKYNFDIMYKSLQKNANQIIHPRTFDQNGKEVSSGTKIINYFPYITRHPINFKEIKSEIDMGTARFLMMSGQTLKKVGYINKSLIQYLGDNDFTLKAKKLHNINSYILRDAICLLDDTETGSKNNNINNINELFQSFRSIKSPNNIKYRYLFFKEHFNGLFSFFITMSMTINSIIKFIIRKII